MMQAQQHPDLSLLRDKNYIDFSSYFNKTKEQVTALLKLDPTLSGDNQNAHIPLTKGNISFIYQNSKVVVLTITHSSIYYRGYECGEAMVLTYKNRIKGSMFYGIMGTTPIGGIVSEHNVNKGLYVFKVTCSPDIMAKWIPTLING